MPTITVVVTAYNLERDIVCCLDELMQQTCQDFSVLLVDDCSQDDTRALVLAHAARFPGRIDTLFLSENLGSPARTRNLALDSGRIKGEYVLFLDGDDRIEKDMLETLLQAARVNDADMAICAYDRVEAETGRQLCRELLWLPDGGSILPESDAPAFLNSALWNKLIRVRAIGQKRLPDFRVGEDLCFMLEVLSGCKGIVCVSRELIHYRVRAGSVMTTTTEEDAFAFGERLYALYQEANETWRAQYALASFIHMGLSMPSRIVLNPAVRFGRYMRRTYAYMRNGFSLYRNARFLKLRSLAKRGGKGVLMWLCLQTYRLRLAGLAFRCYRFVAPLLRKNVRF